MSTDTKTTATASATPATTTATTATTANTASTRGADGRPKTIVNTADLPQIPFDHTMPLFALTGVNAELEKAQVYTATRQFLGRTAGSVHLGCSLYTTPPGKVGAPYHYHDANEEAIYVLSGSGTLRLGGQFIPIEQGDYMTFAAPGTEQNAHQIVNTSASAVPLRYLCLSTMILPEVCTYPDSGKIGVITNGRNFKLFSTTHAVPYFKDEPIPPLAVVNNKDGKSAASADTATAATTKPVVVVATDTKKPAAAPTPATTTIDKKSRPKTIVNAQDVPAFSWDDLPKPFFEMTPEAKQSGKYEFSIRALATAVGAVHIGASLYEVKPGKVAWPYHAHFPTEEAIFIISGTGTLRLATENVAVRAGDYIALLPGKPEALTDSAHQLINTGTESLQYICFSTRPRGPEYTSYPDSNKQGVLLPNDIDYILFPTSARVDYWFGEGAPTLKTPVAAPAQTPAPTATATATTK